MNRILEVAVPLAVTAGVGIAGFYFYNQADSSKHEKGKKKKNSQPDLLSDLPGPVKESEGPVTPDDEKSEVLLHSDNGNSIASQFSVISDADFDRNDSDDKLDEDAIPDDFPSLVIVGREEGQGDAAIQATIDELGASMESGRSLLSQLSVISIGSSTSDIEAIDDINNSSGNGNGDKAVPGQRETTGIIAQETGGGKDKEELDEMDEKQGIGKEIYDILILHAEEDRKAVIKFADDLKKIEKIDLKVAIFEEFAPDIQSQFQSMTVVFERCRYLFVYISEHFRQEEMKKFQNEMALTDSLTYPEKRERIIPIWTCDQGERLVPELGILVGMNYQKREMDESFKNSICRLIQNGRGKYLMK